MNKAKAIFLDRDGVLIEDTNLLVDSNSVIILERVPRALRVLKAAGFLLLIVTNQTVVSRGLVTENEVRRINDQIAALLELERSPRIDGIYVCPHHPNATLETYRTNCDCRKPEPGLLFQAARDHVLDLSACFMVGDRITDVIAGHRAGCRTVLVETGKHDRPPIETVEPLDESIQPDYICDNLWEAAGWILNEIKSDGIVCRLWHASGWVDPDNA